MKTFHKVCVIIFQAAIANLILVGLIGLIIGGDALTGKVENGKYFLGNHGQFIETNYFIFWYSKIHIDSLLVTHPLAMLAGLLYWITGGASFRPKSEAAIFSFPNSNTIINIKSLSWKFTDSLNGFFWIIFDSWRKPDYELFVRESQKECIQKLHFATDSTDEAPTLYKVDKPIWGHFSGNHFHLQKWDYIPLLRDGGASIRPILAGKFLSTPQGTYIRLWHRFTTIWILFLTIWFGTALCILSLYLISTMYPNLSQSELTSTLINWAFIIAPIFYISILLISVFIGSFAGKANNFDIIGFVKDVLDYHHTSSQLAGFRLSRKLHGKV